MQSIHISGIVCVLETGTVQECVDGCHTKTIQDTDVYPVDHFYMDMSNGHVTVLEFSISVALWLWRVT